MVVATTIALYASPPSTVCSTPHQINVSCDLDLNPRSSSSSTTIGGLSLLFKSSPSSSSFASHPTVVGDELPSIRTEDHHRAGSFSYSPTKFITSSSSYLKRDNHHQSPVSVLHGPKSHPTTTALPLEPSMSEEVVSVQVPPDSSTVSSGKR